MNTPVRTVIEDRGLKIEDGPKAIVPRGGEGEDGRSKIEDGPKAIVPRPSSIIYPQSTSQFGRTWRVTPSREEQKLWLWCCSKAGEKIIPFILAAVHERCRAVVAERIKRGKQVEQWVVERLEDS